MYTHILEDKFGIILWGIPRVQGSEVLKYQARMSLKSQRIGYFEEPYRSTENLHKFGKDSEGVSRVVPGPTRARMRSSGED